MGEMFEEPTDYDAALWKWFIANHSAVIAELFPFEHELEAQVELCDG